jgi:hypothetical protein
MLTLGAVMAMGSKENFLLLLPCTWLLAGWLGWRGRLHLAGWLATAIITAVGLFIAAVVGGRLSQSSVDVYQASVTPSARLTLLAPGAWIVWERREGQVLVAGAVLLAVLWGWAFFARPGDRAWLRRTAVSSLLALAAAELLLISQYVFYNGDWPNSKRYDFPGFLVFPALAGLEGWLFLRLLRLLRAPLILRKLLGGTLVAGLMAVTLTRGFSLPATTYLNVYTSRWFREAVDVIVMRANAEPGRPLLFVSHSAWDYEAVLSLKRFLAFRHVRNPIFLCVKYGPEDYQHPVGVDQARQLRELSIHGHSGSMSYPWTFEPIDRLPGRPKPLGIGFSGTAGEEAEDLGMIWAVTSL